MKCSPVIGEIGELAFWQLVRPLGSITLAIDMQVWTANFLSIRIPVRGTAVVESYKHDRLSASHLIFSSLEIDATTTNIENELLLKVE